MTDTDTDPGTDPGTPPPPPPPGAGPARRLVRPQDDRMIAGVASGIAAYLGVDPAIVRIVFVVLAFAGASGVIAYIACWALLPEAPTAQTSSAAPRVEASGAPFWIGVGLLALAAMILAGRFGFLVGRGIGTPLVLIAVGLALWKVSQDRAPSPPSWDPRTTPTWTDESPTTEPATMTTATDPTATSERGAAWSPPPVPTRADRRRERAAADRRLDWTPPPVPPRERSFLGRLTIALAFISVGGGVALDQLGLIEYTFALAASTALLVVGLGLVVGTWFGRARWLSLVGLALVPVVIVSSLARSFDVDVANGIGERRYVAASLAELEPAYRLGAGDMDVDLRGVEVPAGEATTEVRLGAGELRLHVPADTRVVVHARVRLGELRVEPIEDGVLQGPTETYSGTELDRTFTFGPAEGTSTLVVDASVGAGQLTIRPVTDTTAEEFTR